MRGPKRGAVHALGKTLLKTSKRARAVGRRYILFLERDGYRLEGRKRKGEGREEGRVSVEEQNGRVKKDRRRTF